MYYKGSQLQPGTFNASDLPQRGRNLAVGHTWVLSSSWVNEFRFGYNYAYHLNAPDQPRGAELDERPRTAGISRRQRFRSPTDARS